MLPDLAIPFVLAHILSLVQSSQATMYNGAVPPISPERPTVRSVLATVLTLARITIA